MTYINLISAKIIDHRVDQNLNERNVRFKAQEVRVEEQFEMDNAHFTCMTIVSKFKGGCVKI